VTITSALRTDHYELTMIEAALREEAADRPCVFEVFARSLPEGRRYGVVGGTGRLLEALTRFRFGDDDIDYLRRTGVVDERTLDWLAGYRFTGDITGYAEGELYFPGSPVLTLEGPFAEVVVLETLVLSILNHDTAVASAAARMSAMAEGRPIIEMGGRRTHEESAIAAARAAYLTGFATTSNLAAGQAYGIPTAGTSSHAFVLLHGDEEAAFRAQVAALGVGTTLLVDTYDVMEGIRRAVAAAGPELGAIRIDSGDLAILARRARELLDQLGARKTRIVVTGDLDEYAIAALAAAPVDVYGVGTSVVTGSGHPTAAFVYKLVELDGVPVAKRSARKSTVGGKKTAIRRHDHNGTMTEEIIAVRGAAMPPDEPRDRRPQVPLVRGGEPVEPVATLDESRDHHAMVMATLPLTGFSLGRGEPAIPTVYHEEH
jgi:nicotinate phosphoribosyltransferase